MVAHKAGDFLKPPASPVQHEVRVQDGPSQPQPTMTISRSQSPPPPVDWKTYTSLGGKLRPPTASSPRPRCEQRAGAGIVRKTAPFVRYKGAGTGQGLFLLWSPRSQRPAHSKIRGAGLPAVSLLQKDLRCSEPKKRQVPLQSSSDFICPPISQMRRLRPIKETDFPKVLLPFHGRAETKTLPTHGS